MEGTIISTVPVNNSILDNKFKSEEAVSPVQNPSDQSQPNLILKTTETPTPISEAQYKKALKRLSRLEKVKCFVLELLIFNILLSKKLF